MSGPLLTVTASGDQPFTYSLSGDSLPFFIDSESGSMDPSLHESSNGTLKVTATSSNNTVSVSFPYSYTVTGYTQAEEDETAYIRVDAFLAAPSYDTFISMMQDVFDRPTDDYLAYYWGKCQENQSTMFVQNPSFINVTCPRDNQFKVIHNLIGTALSNPDSITNLVGFMRVVPKQPIVSLLERQLGRSLI